MIVFVFEKLRVFVNVARVVVAKRGRERATEVNILKRGNENGGVSEGKQVLLADRRPVEARRACT